MEVENIVDISTRVSSKRIKENPELMIMSKNIKNTLSEFLKKDTQIEKLKLFSIPHVKFFYGFCLINDNIIPLPILYFSDVKMGAFALTRKGVNVDYFRFALVYTNEPVIFH